MTEDLERTPSAFLSHASEDKESFAEPLARRLAALGVRPWLDRWEIQPGDSLVQRLFEEGIARADAVVVLLSRYSVDKPWVRDEMDSAMVRRIEKGTRLIPLRLDSIEVPEQLRHLRWVNADRTEQGIASAAQEIARTLHGYDPRPTVAPLPAYVRTDIQVPGLSRTDAFLLAEVVREALATGHLIGLDWTKVKGAVEADGLEGEALLESVTALAEADYIDARIFPDGRVMHLGLTSFGFREGIGVVVSDIDQVRQAVVAALVNDPPDGDRIKHDLAERIGTYPLLVEQILRGLQEQNLVGVSWTLGDHSRLHSVSPTLHRLLR